MLFRASLLSLLLVVSLVAQSSLAVGPSGSAAVDSVGLFNYFGSGGEQMLETTRTCGGLVGDCIEEEEEMMMESEVSRRSLAASSSRYVSYQALMKNRVPCNRRGYSYYNCHKGGARKANPYRRGCTYITHCARILN